MPATDRELSCLSDQRARQPECDRMIPPATYRPTWAKCFQTLAARGLYGVLSVGVLFSGIARLHAADPADLGPRDRSTCAVQFGVRDDRFVVQELKLILTERFNSLVSPAQKATLERDLTAQLNAVMDFDLPLTVWARSNAEIREYVRSPARRSGPALNGRQDWGTASANLAGTQADNSLRDLLTTIVIIANSLFNDALAEGTPLRPIDDMAALDRQETLLGQGKVELRLLDPVAAEDITGEAVRFAEGDRPLPNGQWERSRFGVKRSDLSAMLKSLQGRLWIRREIKVRIADYYQLRGAPAVEPVHLVRKLAAANAMILDRKGDDETIEVKTVLGGTWQTGLVAPEYGLVAVKLTDHPSRRINRRILVTEPRFIGKLTLALAEKAPPDLSAKLLYTLLDEADWQAAQRIGLKQLLKKMPALGDSPAEAAQPDVYSVSIDRLREKERQLPRPQSYWPLSDQNLSQRAHALTPLGYSALLVEGNGRRAALHLSPLPRKEVVEKMTATKPEEINGEEPVAIDGVVVPGATAAEELAEPSPGPKQNAPRIIVKEYRNFLQGSVAYHEGRGVELQGAYRRVLRADRTAQVTVEAGTIQEFSGNMTLQKDFFLFDRLHRRLAVDLKTYSDYAPDQPAGVARANERRSGARAGLEIEILRARAGAWLVGRMEATRELVETETTGGGPKTSRHDSSVSLGATCFWRNPGRLNSADLTWNANLKFVRTGGTAFSLWEMGGRYHRPVGAFLQAELSAKIAHASSATPLSDLPQLGGAASVRGYREDVASGPTIAFGRAELWFPLRGLEARWPAFGPTLRKQYFAAFADVGVWRSVSCYRTLAGVGVGLRLRPSPVAVLKIDVARGLTEVGLIRGLTRLHLDVSADFPF